MKLYPSFCLLISYVLVASEAFSLGSPKVGTSNNALTTTSPEEDNFLTKAPMQLLGGIVLSSVLAFGGGTPAPAHASDASTLLPQPSLLVAETIKTLDMGLPSYDDVSDAKASVETVNSLSVEPSKSDSGGGSKRAKSSASKEEKINAKKEAQAAKQKAREEFEKEKLGGIKVETVDFSVPSYGDSTAQQQRSAFSL